MIVESRPRLPSRVSAIISVPCGAGKVSPPLPFLDNEFSPRVASSSSSSSRPLHPSNARRNPRETWIEGEKERVRKRETRKWFELHEKERSVPMKNRETSRSTIILLKIKDKRKRERRREEKRSENFPRPRFFFQKKKETFFFLLCRRASCASCVEDEDAQFGRKLFSRVVSCAETIFLSLIFFEIIRR